jgi:hypothetical protein
MSWHRCWNYLENASKHLLFKMLKRTITSNTTTRFKTESVAEERENIKKSQMEILKLKRNYLIHWTDSITEVR